MAKRRLNLYVPQEVHTWWKSQPRGVRTELMNAVIAAGMVAHTLEKRISRLEKIAAALEPNTDRRDGE